MRKRTGRDIWNGLYEFYLIESNSKKKLTQVVKTDALLSLLGTDVKEVGSVRHQLTHQTLEIRFLEVGVKPENLTKNGSLPADLSFISMKKAAEVPKPIAITRHLENANY